MRRLLLLVPLLVLVLAACGSGEGDGSASAPTTDTTPDQGAGVDGSDGAAAGGGIAQADNDLQIEIDLGDGSAPQIWTLTCVGFVEGSHPEAEAACDHLAGIEDPFAPQADDVMCTQVYGGPETAHVVGRWGGQPVDLRLSRTDGCGIDRWDSLVPVVPAPAG